MVEPTLRRRKVAMKLVSAFKPGTDDMRESPPFAELAVRLSALRYRCRDFKRSIVFRGLFGAKLYRLAACNDAVP